MSVQSYVDNRRHDTESPELSLLRLLSLSAYSLTLLHFKAGYGLSTVPGSLPVSVTVPFLVKFFSVKLFF